MLPHLLAFCEQHWLLCLTELNNPQVIEIHREAYSRFCCQNGESRVECLIRKGVPRTFGHRAEMLLESRYGERLLLSLGVQHKLRSSMSAGGEQCSEERGQHLRRRRELRRGSSRHGPAASASTVHYKNVRQSIVSGACLYTQLWL